MILKPEWSFFEMNTYIAHPQVPRLLTTKELAFAISVEPASIRRRHCTTGSYHGVFPVKMPNRRLMWPADSLAQLTKGAK